MGRAEFGFRIREACPACASTQARTLYCCRFDRDPIADYLRGYYAIDTSRLGGGEFRLAECQACGTMYQAEVGDPELLAELYSHWVASTDSAEDDPAYAFDVANPVKSRDGHEILAAASFLGTPPNQLRVLDYGMGWASWGRIAAGLGCAAFGTDLSAERMEYAGRHGITPLTDAEIETERFHFINMEQAMEHVAEPGPVTERLAGALRPGGVLKVSVPSNRGVHALIERLNAGQSRISYGEIMPVQPLEHVNCFTLEGLVRLGRRFGLEPVRPRLADRYAFLRRRGSLAASEPKRLVKELVRPWYQFHNPRNLYVWLRKA